MKDATTGPFRIHLGLPVRPPSPVAGCDVCAACFRQWRHASTPGHPAYDLSHATDLAVEIGRHPHPWALR